MVLEEVSSVKMYEGLQKVFSHVSSETKTKMTFGIYLPKQVKDGNAGRGPNANFRESKTNVKMARRPS